MNLIWLASGAFIAATLYGCSDEKGGNITTTAKPITGSPTTTTTTTTTGPPPPPRDGNMVVNLMNTEYFGYSTGNKSSPFGNTIRIAHDAKIWCGGADCQGGEPDCRVSASIFNSKMMIDPHNNWRAGGWFNYQNGQGMTGLYVNSTLVTQKLAKCTYAWDGATTGKLNRGCGCPRPTGPDSCNITLHPEAPYFDNCEGHTCNRNDHEISSCLCKNWSGDQPANGVGNMCFWKGVAFDTTVTDDSPDEIHEMLDWRVSHTADGSGAQYGPAILSWNEIVLDGQRVLDAMKSDPAGTMVAVVYSGQDQNLQAAKGIASEVQKTYRLSKPIPVIMLNESANVKDGSPPWVYREEDQVVSTMLV